MMNKSMDESRSELHFKVHCHSHNKSLRWKLASLLRNCTLKKMHIFGHFCNLVLSQKRTNSVLSCFDPVGLG